MTLNTARPFLAEFIGSLLLSGVVIGSGILGVQLSGGNDGIALIGNSAATGAILWVLVATLGPISGAHFNPAVTAAFFLRKEISAGKGAAFAALQIIGCVLGAWLAHAMFEQPILQIAVTDRSGSGTFIAEIAATFALIFAIFGAIKYAPGAVPAAVALVITAGYWWTSSTSFANPAITIARSLTDSFAGIGPRHVPSFITAQFIGAVLATGVAAILFRDDPAP